MIGLLGGTNMPSSSKDAWRDDILMLLPTRYGERTHLFITTSGIDIDTVYTPEDLINNAYK